MNLSEFLEFEARDLEAEFAGRTAGDATPRAIRRRRTVRAGATAGVAAVALGAVALGGLRLAGWDVPEPGADDVVGVDGRVRVNVADDSGMHPLAHVSQCGSAAPTPTGAIDGFAYANRGASAVTINPIASDRDGTVVGSISSARTDAADIAVSDIAFVWTQGGTVVAYSVSDYSARPTVRYTFTQIEPHSFRNVSGTLSAETYLCDSPAGGPWSTVPAGTYEVFPVARVTASPEVAGWLALRNADSVLVPGSPADPELVPRSEQCVEIERQVNDGTDPDSRVPRECRIGPDDPAQPNVYSVDYAGDQYIASIDATLVGTPMTVTVSTSWQDAVALRDAQKDTSSLHPACASPLPDNYPSSRPGLFVYLVADDVLSPEMEGPVRIGVGSDRLSAPATVEFSRPLRVWFVGAGESGEDARIVGSGTIVVGGDTQVTLTKNHTVALLDGTLSDVVMCEEPTRYIGNWFVEGSIDITDLDGNRSVSLLAP